MTVRAELESLASELSAHMRLRTENRLLAAIAGAPGSGKSTVADRLAERLNEASPGCTAVLGMDGYHYDDLVLNERGHRLRKGAPHTFDVDGFAAMLERLKSSAGRPVAVPIFDRDLEIARAGARIIAPETRLIIVEGNYLLLDDPAWAPLRALFDVTVMLAVPEAVLVQRLTNRWNGYGLTGDAFNMKMDGNDLPNMRLVLSKSVPADFVLDNV